MSQAKIVEKSTQPLANNRQEPSLSGAHFSRQTNKTDDLSPLARFSEKLRIISPEIHLLVYVSK